ncbi:cysteine desulfuration protein SufE/hypothetical protein [Bisgaardia hudsonensis]|uniref:Fe-S metabolism associated domain-containing protein n=1 Tax=Bisgaardia hudsonensis TaxID=109472 RepID=A0A4R2MZS2_9PAST|nr:SufE family protein [Bisgaardia hudsonensis]QLB13294.1 hypothetical protein A6A11_06560 [Bisgaardia hudsonensis]TCP10960.1 cysteine desulfuration protein SufE/hypothetical protein [Bisgaardia hudsonensis]
MKEKLQQAKSWEDRYRLIIQYGKNLSRPTEEELADMQIIKGCEAGVWFKIIEKNDRTFIFQAYSEARIINGLLWIILQEINGKNAKQLQSFNLNNYFDELHITQKLSTTRLNGLKKIEEIIKTL